MADTSSIPDNLEELIASCAKFDGGPEVPENAWVEVGLLDINDRYYHILQIPHEGTLGFFAEENNVQRIWYWRPGNQTQDLEPGREYSLSVHRGDAIMWQYLDGSKVDIKMAWWFK